MAPPGINAVLTIVMIIGFGAYFAWGITREAKRNVSGHKRLIRQEAAALSKVLVGAMVVAALLVAWRFGTWQPVWVLSGIAIVMLIGLRIWANR
jgi:hypothetical protein